MHQRREVLLQCLDTGAAVYLHQGARGNGAGELKASGPVGDTAEGIICGEMLLLCISKTSLFSFNPDIVTHELVTLGQIIQ